MTSTGHLTNGILFTDHYQLTMAQLYFRAKLAERQAQFDHFFRHYPDYGRHQAGYCITAGVGPLVEWMSEVRFESPELEVLRGVKSSNGGPIFGEDFLGWLAREGSFEGVSMRAVPEGRVVHPNTPLSVVEGPLAMTQILETPLLNQLNFATLIATKASRVVEAAHGAIVMEFGLRRAHGNGANAATRAALIGGAHYSSNVAVSHELGIPSKGTHAHSMVQVFMAIAGGELEAFEAYADTYPDDCLLLVDTIDTLESGVPNAIKVFEGLRRRGHRPIGIRLDSGDLAHLAVRSARLLDDAGFDEVAIVLSSGLDELTIWQIRNQIIDEAPRYGLDPDGLLKRLVYGVGTKMITSDGDPSLDGVYKVVAVKDDGSWVPAIKISDSPEKVPNPGAKRLWRIYDARGTATADVLALADEDLSQRPLNLHHPTLPGVGRTLSVDDISQVEALHVEVFTNGKPTAGIGGVEEARQRRNADIGRLDPGVRRLVNPHTYHVSLTDRLAGVKRSLVDSYTE